jgi:hypothetical protein
VAPIAMAMGWPPSSVSAGGIGDRHGGVRRFLGASVGGAADGLSLLPITPPSRHGKRRDAPLDGQRSNVGMPMALGLVNISGATGLLWLMGGAMGFSVG